MPLDSESQKRLRNITAGIVEATNNRNFDLNSTPWKTCFAPQFLAGPFPPTMPQKLTLEKWLDHLAWEASQAPEWKIEILDSDPVPGQTKNSASLYFNFGATGRVPDGIQWRSVGVFDFQCFSGEWLAIAYRGFDGHGGVEMF
ncbi:uncharacterized protein RCC_07498 [Ramularia collo-cygni]|uniref:SnoaL-like domain-containing protein n=1 Tax=Ramularia collo-cygni TaxID=112498 RepID=A0A2D3VKN3_9PEZI|nr:uncharacterized protein RCC_07498 [Ramularia collo-cygni]CZT21633.1 uncharacterized protein RCC_07498 [Ramularia collo-cygni]